MAGSSAATSRPPDLPPADCESSPCFLGAFDSPVGADTSPSFAFVEYEDRRDADDAYHDMHNKRLGRDDILKIEVRCPELHTYCQVV